MGNDHYFTAEPASEEQLRTINVTLADRPLTVTTAAGVFSPDHVDAGTGVLLSSTPAPPPGGDFLDLGCGWGPISISLALQAPHATVWAVDVNERALDLVRRNASALGLSNIRAVTPDAVPEDVLFRTIRSNPPIRVGKRELHSMLQAWLPRLDVRSDAWLVIAKQLGADSLQRWLSDSLPCDFSVSRANTARGFRVLKVRHHESDAPTGATTLDP